MADTIKTLAKVILESKEKGTSPYDTTAEVVRIDGNTAWCHIPGGIDETPVNMTIACAIGDTVQVRVSGGRAWITGNQSAPPTDDTVAKEARTSARTAEVKAVEASELSAQAKEQAAAAAKVAADTEQHFWFTETGTDTGAHITEKTQKEFLQDPEIGGGNLLARSNGVAIRDGLTEVASFFTTINGNNEDVSVLSLLPDWYGIGTPDVYLDAWRDNNSGGASQSAWLNYGGTYPAYILLRSNANTSEIFLNSNKTTANGNVEASGNITAGGDIYIGANKLTDYVIARGTSGNWKYIKWASGRVECEGYYTFSSLTFTQRGQLYRSNATAFTVPSGIFTSAPTEGQAWIQSGSASDYFGAVIGSLTTTGGNCMVWKATSGNATNVSVHMRLIYR